jgi:alpha-N-arabinofuranosidase
MLLYEGHDAVYDAKKAGPKEYLNPILPGYYPDPSVLRVGEDYYLVNSSFTHFPGLPVWQSKDLVHWNQIGNAVDRTSRVKFDGLDVSRGLYAPAIDYKDGTFYIINTCVDCGGNFVITAKNPAGPWSDPIWLPFEGIDPSLFFDKDGKTYVVNNGAPEGTPLYQGHRAIWIQEYDVASGKMTGPRKVLVNGGTDISKKPVWIEGPHLFKVKNWYYLMCAEGGTGEQHSEVIFRSKSVWGPFTPYKGNPILTQRDLYPDREFPVTSTGHAQLVETAKGDWWSVFLGTRPYGNDLYNTGRETFLLPVTWKNGWPIILGKGQKVPFVAKAPSTLTEGPVAAGNFGFAETFAKDKLGPEWVMIRTPKEQWYSVGGHKLTLKARPDAIGSAGNPSFLAVRQQHSEAAVTTTLTFAPKIDGERAGLVAFQNSNAFYFFGLVREGGKLSLCVSKKAGKSDSAQGETVTCEAAKDGPVTLKIAIKGGKADFLYGASHAEMKAIISDIDATILSTKKAGGFVGTVIGPYAYTP